MVSRATKHRSGRTWAKYNAEFEKTKDLYNLQIRMRSAKWKWAWLPRPSVLAPREAQSLLLIHGPKFVPNSLGEINKGVGLMIHEVAYVEAGQEENRGSAQKIAWRYRSET
jgi:hypothetical protein